jgi:heparan-alpha-glucosaminide N-acetyltransferase
MKIKCGVKGDVGHVRNVVGFVDRFLFGLKYMKNHATYQHILSCSLHSPNYGALPPNAPNWSLSPFKHEGDISIVKKSMSLKFKH